MSRNNMHVTGHITRLSIKLTQRNKNW